MAEEKLTFQTEVSRLLHIVANSLYSEKQIFLRELISNASDACDRLRYEAITHPELTADDPEFAVRIAIDKKAQTIEVAGLFAQFDGTAVIAFRLWVPMEKEVDRAQPVERSTLEDAVFDLATRVERFSVVALDLGDIARIEVDDAE